MLFGLVRNLPSVCMDLLVLAVSYGADAIIEYVVFRGRLPSCGVFSSFICVIACVIHSSYG